MKNLFLLFFILLSPAHRTDAQNGMPAGFVKVQELIPNVDCEIRYAGSHNFTGKPVEGYRAAVPILSLPAAKALNKVQEELKKKGYGLKIFDAYRPQRAVDSFVRWARDPEDTLAKQEFYPEVPKNQLFELGYIASRSGHSRGSTVDLSLIDLKTGQEIDMGSPYDFFGETSHHNTSQISAEQKQNRDILKKAMMQYGFRPYTEEWWHYTLNNEPYPDTYFDFVVE